ncbi:MAG: hydroxyacid dehydrogenase [Gammaproteobacteria bacterium]|nr:hydroxyacid dehydrogenase [Gammaproteobacteria bacterium]
MAKKPITAMLMHPVVKDELFRSDHLDTIGRVCKLVESTPFRDLEAISSHLAQIEVLITSWGCPRIDQVFIDQMPRLRLIAHLAGSVKGFIDDTVWRKGIRVVNAVAANAVPVAEYTVAAILFANKQVFQLNRFYIEHRENRAPWNKEAPDVGNYQKTVGVVGASHVGRLVIEHLNHFDFRVLLYDPYLPPLETRHIGAYKVGLTELLSQSDVVSLHAPLLADTHGMIGSRELALMRDGATLINTARGAIVDQSALEAELANGRIFAILDTTVPEELPRSSPLFRMENVFLTPHIAGSLGNETQRLTDLIVAELERYHLGQSLKHQVKREHLARLA